MKFHAFAAAFLVAVVSTTVAQAQGLLLAQLQCQANYRASAFTYLYRVLEAGDPEADARADMNRIWEPEGTWAEFVDDVKASYAD